MASRDPHVNIFQLSGLDERERGFTRQVECTCHENEYHVCLRYERVKVEGHSQKDESSALQNLIDTLQEKGYTQLRSQLIFCGETYLGSQELWVNYPDTERSDEQKPTTFERIRQWLKTRKQLKHRNKALRQC